MSMMTYHNIYHRLAGWIQDGKLPFKGEFSDDITDDLDKFILSLFGVTWTNDKDTRDLISALDAISPRDRTAEIAWLNGPHALTLLKAKMARDE